ncbi:family 10 glycosylhydrolase [Streptomyces sp. LHD-70]|uniref:glycoside hydrolase family 10 protein n=1 Tax=Streptomyces sp. LHD-70 TaxID=3072140 RepID=UPI00280DBC1F|nr:family 10 glycosylhydrolase [Streptomyces sp. LHD-70]MDQ8703131.1 family 10 glycosylhydrolase [Streptomyces sp. LHD-70]
MDIGRKGRHSVRISRRAFGAAAAAVVSGLAVDSPAVAQGRGEPGRQGERHGGDGGRREMRGMWLASVDNRDWPSAPGLGADEQRAELIAYLDGAVRRRLNTVIFQARPAADALWPSPYEPWSEYLTGVQGQDPGWDPLGTAVEEAHRRGLELHAWFNPYRVAIHGDLSRLAPTHPARTHPEWVVPYGGKLYYNPGLPQVRRFVQDAMLDAVRRYAVDGVHWDDYFYPYPHPGEVFDDDEAYARYGAGFPDRADWRRHNTDLLVREMAARIPRVRRGVEFGISPFGVWRNSSTDPRGSDTAAGAQAYDDLYADTRSWVRRGWIDYVVPQLYWNIGFPAADYARLLPWWADVVRGTGVRLCPGEALYKAGDPAQPTPWQDPGELSRHLALASGFGEVRGHAFFSAKEVVLDPFGAMARVVADHYERS